MKYLHGVLTLTELREASVHTPLTCDVKCNDQNFSGATVKKCICSSAPLCMITPLHPYMLTALSLDLFMSLDLFGPLWICLEFVLPAQN